MAKTLHNPATMSFFCGHPLCDTEVQPGELIYTARFRDEIYCSHLCRERHTKLLIQQRRRDDAEANAHDNFNRRFRKYGITQEEFERLYDEQLGRCAICMIPFSETRVHVDHNHRTGVTRGLLCNECNPGLGFFNDSPGLLEKAAAYLRERG